jgi:hypothetical protein
MRSMRFRTEASSVLRVSSIDLVPKASSKPRDTAALFSCGIMSSSYSDIGTTDWTKPFFAVFGRFTSHHHTRASLLGFRTRTTS